MVSEKKAPKVLWVCRGSYDREPPRAYRRAFKSLCNLWRSFEDFPRCPAGCRGPIKYNLDERST